MSDVAHVTTWVDLSAATYGDDPVAEYATRRLVAGRYEASRAKIVAREVATRAKQSFVVAELVARMLAEREPIDTHTRDWRRQIPTDLRRAFQAYLARFGEERERVLSVLHPLAHARGEGLTVQPPTAWLALANALRRPSVAAIDEGDLEVAQARAHD